MKDGRPASERRVLYIDDDPALARLVQRHLVRHGYQVATAPDGQAGIARIGGEIFDLVALDHYMPGLDGIATLERIRLLPDPPPVVFVTGADDSRIAVAALKAGAADYVIKDSHENFLTLLMSALDQAAEQVELRRAKARADAELRIAKEMAERASRAKGRLLAATGHDLKQPLQVIALTLDQIEARSDARLAPALSRANRAVATLDRAFDTLLQAARFESGAVVPQRAVVRLAPLFEAAAGEWISVATDKGLSIRTVPSRCQVDTDPEMLGTILRNFIGNAIKYTDSGGVVIGCRRHGGMAELQVVDTGIGIDAAALPGLFDEFRQIDPEGRRGGLGLGLSIVKRTADLLGHEVTVRSRPRGGSCFAVRVPIVP